MCLTSMNKGDKKVKIVMMPKVCGALLLLVVILSTASCAPKKPVAKDPFFDKWETLAAESKGYSPAARVREISLPEVKAPPEIPDRPLPKNKINLKMRGAEIKALVRSMARAIDHHILINNDIKGEITVDFKDVPWDQAFLAVIKSQGLSYVWEGDIIRVLTVEEMERDLRIAAASEKRLQHQIGVRLIEPLLTVMVNIDYAEAKSLKDNIQELITKDKDGKARGTVRVEEHSNSLIIQASREDILRIVPVIERIDKPAFQVLIKGNIVEATKDTARNLGVQWGGMYGTTVGGQSLFVTPGGTGGVAVPPGSAHPGTYTPSAGGPKGIAGQGFGVNLPAAMTAAGAGSLGVMFGTIGGNILEVQLNALQKDGKLNILSSPSITTLDNQKAFTENGERIPFVVTDKDGNRIVQFQDAVLRLEITPHVIDGKSLRMKIMVKKDEVDMSRKVEGNPLIIKKQTETTLIVNNGETIVISGLTKQKSFEETKGIPFLMKVPVLEWLFKGEGKTNSMEEVLIFITPTILPPQTAAVKTPPEGKADRRD